MVTTPAGDAVAMAHSNNCTSDLNAWVNVFREFAEAMGMEVDMNKLFGTLYNKALEGDPDCGGLLSYCYFSGEHMTGFEEGRPLFVRSPESKFTLANFMRTHLYTCLGAMRVGLNILMDQEHVKIDRLLGHGGLFKTKGVGQQILGRCSECTGYLLWQLPVRAVPGVLRFWLLTLWTGRKARLWMNSWTTVYLQEMKEAH